MTERLRPLVAQAAEADELRELLAVVLEALDIPYAATTGGDEVRSRVLADRTVKAVVTLRSVAAGLPRWSSIRQEVDVLRELLAEHPVQGYVTDTTARARREAGQDYMQSVTPQTPEEGGQSVSEGDADEHQAHAEPGPDLQI